MKFHKFISVLLHPLVIPTIGAVLFLLFTPQFISSTKQYTLIALVFFSTYIVPLISLIILKILGVIKSFQVHTIKERKIPIFIMLLLFYLLGKLLITIPEFKELGVLFYGCNFATVVIYFLFFFKIKTSLHIMSMSSAIGFLLLFSTNNDLNLLPIISIFVFLTGILASARLHLKAHTGKEIMLGFVIGIVSQFVMVALL